MNEITVRQISPVSIEICDQEESVITISRWDDSLDIELDEELGEELPMKYVPALIKALRMSMGWQGLLFREFKPPSESVLNVVQLFNYTKEDTP